MNGTTTTQRLRATLRRLERLRIRRPPPRAWYQRIMRHPDALWHGVATIVILAGALEGAALGIAAGVLLLAGVILTRFARGSHRRKRVRAPRHPSNEAAIDSAIEQLRRELGPP